MEDHKINVGKKVAPQYSNSNETSISSDATGFTKMKITSELEINNRKKNFFS